MCIVWESVAVRLRQVLDVIRCKSLGSSFNRVVSDDGCRLIRPTKSLNLMAVRSRWVRDAGASGLAPTQSAWEQEDF